MTHAQTSRALGADQGVSAPAVSLRRSDRSADILVMPPPATAALMCCKVRVDAISAERAVERVLSWPRGMVVHLCNSYTLALARKDPAYAEMINRGDLNLPDGTPLAWLGKREQIPGFTSATRGPDLMREALRKGQDRGTRHYLYGSTPEVLARLREQIREFAPDAEVVGLESPPFGDQDEQAYAAAAGRMTEARADVVWVGLGTPRQDWAADALGRHADAVVVPVGAAFDFLAGTKPEAPRVLRDSGLEWVFRLMTEPRRLWRRYLVGNAGFLRGVLQEGVHRLPDVATPAAPAVVQHPLRDRLLRGWRKAVFHSVVRTRPRPGMVRLGSEYGGWSVDPSLLQPGDVAYCAGVGEDITFDQELIKQFGVEVHAFDPTPRAISYVRAQEPDPCFVFHPVGVWSGPTTLRFYAPRDPSHVSHSVTNIQRTSSFFTAPCDSVPSLMQSLDHRTVALLKLDVEGAEHEALGPVLSLDQRIKTICVEFDQPSPVRMVLRTCRRLRRAGYTLVARQGWDCTFVLTSQH